MKHRVAEVLAALEADRRVEERFGDHEVGHRGENDHDAREKHHDLHKLLATGPDGVPDDPKRGAFKAELEEHEGVEEEMLKQRQEANDQKEEQNASEPT